MGPFDWGACLPFFLVAAAAQSIICPPLGPILPPPKGKLSNHALIKSLSQNLTETLDILFHPSNATSRFHQFQANLTSISLEVVSTSDQDPLFAYYHTANLLNSTGTQLVTDRTIFRIGSITKLFTVLALILHEDKFSWQDSITKHVPELLDSESFKMSNQGQLDSVLRTQWQNITLEQLASHLSGMPRDIVDLSATVQLPWTDLGFPTLNRTDLPRCGANVTSRACSRQEFVDAIILRTAVFEPLHTPSYSNAAFTLLGLALESIVGRDYESIIESDVFKPLELVDSSVSKPRAVTGIIPIGASGWDQDDGVGHASGGIYSSSRGLSRFSRALLSHETMSSTRTQRWLKPQSHTSSLTFSIGSPWEIIRSNSLTSDNAVMDLYTKSGGIGQYGSLTLLVPDYNIALIVLLAGDSGPINVIAEAVIRRTLPALELIAKEQASVRYAGTYRSGNSSISISVGGIGSGAGLKVDSWISNGRDILAEYAQIFRPFKLKLYPTGISQLSGSNHGKLAVESFRGVYEYPASEYDSFLNQCRSWEGFDGNVYGQRALDEFIFHLDENRAVSIEPRAVRQLLKREAAN